MAKITTSEFQKGMFIDFQGNPHQIVEFQFVNPGKGSAFIRTKLKNIKTGRVQEFTYKSGEVVEQIPVEVHEMQFLYKSGNQFYFMDRFTYEQITLSEEIIGDFHRFLKEGDIFQIYQYNNQALGIKIPKKVRLKVIEAEEGVRGDTVSGAKKLVKLETGIDISAPLFIKKGDLVAVDPETGEYLERVNQ